MYCLKVVGRCSCATSISALTGSMYYRVPFSTHHDLLRERGVHIPHQASLVTTLDYSTRLGCHARAASCAPLSCPDFQRHFTKPHQALHHRLSPQCTPSKEDIACLHSDKLTHSPKRAPPNGPGAPVARWNTGSMYETRSACGLRSAKGGQTARPTGATTKLDLSGKRGNIPPSPTPHDNSSLPVAASDQS